MREITEDEMQGYVRGFQAREARKEAERKALEGHARRAVARWVERLRALPEVRRVILYGSLAKGAFRENSDIDLAVEGLPAESHFRVWAELERGEDFHLDLHRCEELSEGFLRVIEGYGELLYARP
jgi:predicted nucleotidyltransferase